MNDNSILTLLRSDKHTQAFSELYDHYPPVEKMIYRSGGSRHDAKDIYQEALIILYNKAKDENFRLTAKLSTYLFSVCRFLWMDETKKRGKMPTDKISEKNDPALEEDITKEVEKERKLQLAEKAIASLGEKCREILRLCYFDKKSMGEIAKLLGYSSENTARNQKYKCLESAKKKLTESIHI
jgi:RNA polymerase sigma factor (sigma-70 family)